MGWNWTANENPVHDLLTLDSYLVEVVFGFFGSLADHLIINCLLYTSDAADDMQCVDLGGRRIIKKTQYIML